MTADQLRKSILQQAIQGKLVPQDPNDEPASVLLERIREEKARLVKEKKIKKEKSPSIIFRGEDNSYYEKFTLTGEVKCIDDEISFDLPKGWEWGRWGSIAYSIQYGVNAAASHIGKIKMVRISDIQNDRITWEGVPYCDIDKKDVDAYSLKTNDILFARTGGTVGKSFLIQNIHEDAIYAGYLIRTRYSSKELSPLYLKYFMGSTLYWEQLKDGVTRTAQPNCNGQTLGRMLLPIPPLAEQERIVAKLEELIPLVEQYGKAQCEFEALNSNIREQLKKSVLQYAIEGKLIPQCEEDGTAEDLLEEIQTEKQRLYAEGKLKKKDLAYSSIFRGEDNKYFEKKDKDIVCIDEEIPFDLPETWAWVRLEDICEYIQRGKSPKYSPIKKYPVIAQKCNQWSGFSIEKAQFIVPETISNYGEERKLQDRDLLWNSTGLGTLGRIAIYYSKLNPYELAVADSHVTVIRALKKHVSPEYLYAYFSSYTVQSVIEHKSDGSTKQKELATNTVKAYLVPLPPYEEQKCIVNCIDKVFAYLT